MIKTHLKADNLLLHLLAIILVTFIYYYGSISNYFFADDFIWLDRVKHLQGNWSSIFSIENTYFTPLTYLSFLVNYELFGLNPYWYHLLDVMLHALNGVLLYFLTYQLSRNKLTALIAAIAFVSSFSIVITVLWPSARTDLLMVFFSLTTIIAFVKTRAGKLEFVPVLFYILALSAKGTALVLPLVLFLLTARDKPLKGRLGELLPYLLINGAYASLLLLVKSPGAENTVTLQNFVSFTNYARALPTLIVPERYLAGAGTPLLVVIAVVILVAMVVLAYRLKEPTVRIGAAVAVFGILPLLFAREYLLAGNKAAALNLLSSPSNRVYLAAAGISLVYAVVFKQLLDNKLLPVRILSCALLLALLSINYHEIGRFNKKWRKGASNVRNDMLILERNAPMLTEDAVLLLYNFEGSSGFSTAMIKTLYDLKKFDVHTIDQRFIGSLTDVKRSPLLAFRHDKDLSRIKLLMDCPRHPYADWLTRGGNLILQDILANYREMYASPLADAAPIMKLQQENMANLKQVLNECTFTHN